MRSTCAQVDAAAVAAVGDSHHQRPAAVGDAHPGVARQPWMRRRHLPVAVGAATVGRTTIEPAIVNSGRHRSAVGWRGKSEDAKQ